MDLVDKKIGKDVEIDLAVEQGKLVLKVVVSAKASLDAFLDQEKAKLPEWLQPLVDLAKGEADKVLA